METNVEVIQTKLMKASYWVGLLTLFAIANVLTSLSSTGIVDNLWRTAAIWLSMAYIALGIIGLGLIPMYRIWQFERQGAVPV